MARFSDSLLSDAPTEVSVAGEPLLLLPERALFWRKEALLVVADAHFGKGATFRALGVPVPSGTSAENCAILGALTDRLGVRHILFLGDFLHGPRAQSESTLAALSSWRDLYPGLRLTLVVGNHDAKAGAPPAALGLELASEPYTLGPFRFCHHPGRAAGMGGFEIAGHLHPAVRLLGRAHQSERLPCFWVRPHSLVLPSFGAFTGAALVHPEPGDRMFVVGSERVWPVPLTSDDVE